MLFISITRLRLRSIRFVPGFAVHAVRSNAQVRQAPGLCHISLLNDRAWTFWTMTGWDSENSMRAYMTAGAHRAAMPRLVNWCDEASVVHWSQAEDAMPSWAEADAKMRASGRASKVRHPSEDHAAMTYRAPRLPGGHVIPAG